MISIATIRGPAANEKVNDFSSYLSRRTSTHLREAAEEVGFIQRGPVLDEAGKPTGRYEQKYGTDIAGDGAPPFAALYGDVAVATC
jgi:hypothetical protein